MTTNMTARAAGWCGCLAAAVTATALPAGGAEARAVAAATRPAGPTVRYAGDGSDLQKVIDRAPAGATILCDPNRPVTLAKPVVIAKALTLCGLHARLPKGLGRTSLIDVTAEGVALTDLELRGNYDSVSQKVRAPLLNISAGGFRVERCRFLDGSKDGVMVTPRPGRGDIVGGAIRDIHAERMGRDAVSISGGNAGARVRDVTVENVTLAVGFYRGAVEVSDGVDNVTVRHVRAVKCVYAIDVQDHGKGSAPNTNVTVEDITAEDCRHVVRTANSARGHKALTLRKLVSVRCKRPVVVSHTDGVTIDGLIVRGGQASAEPVTFKGCRSTKVVNVVVEPGGPPARDKPAKSQSGSPRRRRSRRSGLSSPREPGPAP